MTTTPTNKQRAAWAGKALASFIAETNTDREDSLGDLLCDLMHWADRNNFDFAAALDRATDQHQAEKKEEQEQRRQAIVELARQRYASEGELEIDDAALVSDGDDNGAYVQAWCWLDFTGTPFDKEG